MIHRLLGFFGKLTPTRSVSEGARHFPRSSLTRRVDIRGERGVFRQSLVVVVFAVCPPIAAADSWIVRPDAPLFIARVHELPCRDCDGAAVGDISGNAKLDIATSDGKGGSTFWYEQGATAWEWMRRPIYTIERRPVEIEGNDLGDFDGDGRLEAVSLDQPNGKIYLHKQGEDPRGPWRTSVIQTGRRFLQASLVADVDGDGRADLIYTWEGDAQGRGGVHWLQFTGGDVLNTDHWRDHVMVQHESAWWLAPRRADLSGNGKPVDIVYTARNIPARNPAARPGLFWLEPGEDVTQPWVRHTIDDTLNHPLHVDLGDLDGSGQGKDLVVGGFQTQHVYWYRYSENWKRRALPLPELVNRARPDQVWNVKTISFGGARDGILAPVTGKREKRGAFLLFAWRDGAYRAFPLMDIDYDHPMDDRIILHDLDNDGLPEAVIPDSGPRADRLLILKFGRPGPHAPR